MIILPKSYTPIQINVTQLNGQIVVQFDREVREFPLDLQEAGEFIRALGEQFKELAKQKGHEA